MHSELVSYEGMVCQLLSSKICSSSSSFDTPQFGDTKLVDPWGDDPKWSLLNVGVSKPDRPAFIQHTFIREVLCAWHYIVTRPGTVWHSLEVSWRESVRWFHRYAWKCNWWVLQREEGSCLWGTYLKESWPVRGTREDLPRCNAWPLTHSKCD